MSSDEESGSALGEEPVDKRASGKASDEDDDLLDDEGDDLFGDGANEDDDARQRRLDDEDLDSGDDEGRNDRAAQDEEDATETQVLNILDLQYPRCAAPEPGDGEMYYLKVPHFLEIDPTSFSLKSWAPPVTDHHSRGAPSATFSAYSTATSTIRWRRSPSKPSELQSNARVLRWSDGSLTLQLGSDALTQYEIQARAMAPPQHNAIKPTPLSVQDGKGRHKASQGYNVSQDTFSYLAQPYASPQVLRMTNKLTTALTVAPAGDNADDALERLQRSMAAARAGTLADHGDFKPAAITEDPENAKRQAELAEREKLKLARKLEQQQTREAVRMNKARDRAGLRTTGLSVGALEDDGNTGRRGPSGPQRPKQRRGRHREDWSEDELEGEDYEEDDFVAADSDEEEEDAEGESEDDVDARIEARFREEKLAKEQAKTGSSDGVAASGIARAATPKRPAEDEADGAGGGDASPGLSRHKRRRVVEDDDEDD